MTVSIIVPTYNEARFIANCLDSIFAQDYKDFEIIVIDGMSDDRTREILKNYQVKVLSNPKRIKPVALNIGIKHAKGDIIVIMDAHAKYQKDYVSKCVKYLKKYNADNVGGAVQTVPSKNTLTAKAIALSLSHSFGVGSRFRKGTNKIQEVDTVFCGCFKKEVFEKIGYYNENLIRSQDMELNLRLKKAGGKIILSPNIVSYYYPKSTLKDFFLHNIQDGIWAIYPLKFGVTLKLRHYIPLIFLLTLPISIWFYLPVNFLFSFIVALQKRSWKYLYALPLVFVARHIGYGLGSLLGLIKLFKNNNKMIKMPQNELVKNVRKFWYSNTEGDFNLAGEKITRKDIFTYGGPNPKFTCSYCQETEWLSRVKQKNLFSSHTCLQSKECETLCSHQGDELWTHHHQNFDFMFSCNKELPAPKCLYLNDVPTKDYKRFTTPRCDLGERVFKRQWAYACQLDMVQKLTDINWVDYDFLFIDITGCKRKWGNHPNIPIILYGHDFWGYDNDEFQKKIDYIKPDIFLTSYPAQWKEKFKFPLNTKIVFYPLLASTFFNRPNLTDKKIDLLVIGATASSVYKSRVSLDKQLSSTITSHYNIEFSHSVGCLGSKWEKETYNKPVRYLNKWSEYLSTAKFVVFGRMQYPILAWKYGEVLGSGAIPIFPEVPDLERLSPIKPFVHYIPLSEIEGDSEKLSYYLDNYDKYKHIAKNAVEWYNENADRMLFEDFEDNIGKLTNFKFLKRKV